MYIKNERGFTLIEMLVALVLVTFVMTSGYKLITMYVLETQVQVEDTTDILQIDAYNKLFLDDVRHAKNVELTASGEVLELRYSIKDKDKVLTFTPEGETEYKVDYRDTGVKKDDWLKIEKKAGEKPLDYNKDENTLTLNHYLGGIEYDYTIYVRRGQNE